MLVRVEVSVAVGLPVRVLVKVAGKGVLVPVGVAVRLEVPVAVGLAVRVEEAVGVTVDVGVGVRVRVMVGVGLAGGQMASVCRTMLSMMMLPFWKPFRLRAKYKSEIGSPGLMVSGKVRLKLSEFAPATRGALAEAMSCCHLPTDVAAPWRVI